MLNQLALASVMVVITVMVHLIGLNMVMRLLRSHSRFIRKLRITPLTLLLSASLGIFAIHTLEIWLYAALFLGLGAFNSFETALYFSTSTYAAIGYGDLLMPYGWRVLGAIEGATGIIMFGWSTAFLVSLLAKLNLLRHDWLAPDDVRPNAERMEDAKRGANEASECDAPMSAIVSLAVGRS